MELPDAAVYARCTFCSAESFVDLNGTIFTQVIRASVGRSRVPGLVHARALEAGWAAANLTDIDLVYEPVWELECADNKRIRIGGRPGPGGRFEQVDLPGGERAIVKPEDRQGTDEWIEPELAPESLADVAARLTGRPVSVKTIRLVHHPVYVGQVLVSGETRSFRVDAVSGEVFDVDWPVQTTFRRRNRAWSATIVMILAAVILPLPYAALAIFVIGSATAWSTSRTATESGASA